MMETWRIQAPFVSDTDIPRIRANALLRCRIFPILHAVPAAELQSSLAAFVTFAVELAKVTLMLAKELELREAGTFAAADRLHLPERLPLDNLDMPIPALSVFGNS